MQDTENSYSAINDAAFRLYQIDLETLRSKVRSMQRDLPHSFVNQMKRKDLIYALLAEQFGNVAVMDFISQLKAYEDDQAFVEGRDK